MRRSQEVSMNVCSWTVLAHNLATEHATSQRAVCNERDAELLARLENSDIRIFGLQRKGRIFILGSSNRVNSVGSAKRILGTMRDTKVLDFAGSMKGSES